MSIKRRLIINTLVVFFAFIVSVSVFIYKNHSKEVELKNYRNIQNLILIASSLRVYAFEYMHKANERKEIQIEKGIEKVSKLAETYSGECEESKSFCKNVKKQRGIIKSILSEMKEARTSDNPLKKEYLNVLLTQMSIASEKIIDEAKVFSRNIRERSKRNQGFLSLFLFVFIILAAFHVVFNSITMLKIFFESLDSFSTAAKHMSKGDYEYRINMKRKNEFSDFADVFNKMALMISKLQEKAVERAENKGEMEIGFLKEMQESLSEANENLTVTLQSIGDAIIVTDANGYVTRMNPVSENLTGYNQEEGLGMHVSQVMRIINAHTRKKVVNPVEEVFEKGQIVGLANHTVLISKEGKEMQIADSASPIKKENGDLIGAIIVFRDVSEEYKRREELETNINFTNALLNAVPAPIFYKDREGRYLGCNIAFSEIMGVRSEEIAGKTMQELWPSDLAKEYHEKDLQLMRYPEHQTYEFEVKDKNGEIRPVIFAKDVFRNEKGEVAGLVGAFLDITERKRMELVLSRSEEKFKNMLDAIPDMISIHDSDMNILYSNWNGFGAVPLDKRVLKTKCYETYRGLDGVCPDCHAKRVLETKEPFHDEVQLPDGMWIDLRVIPILEGDGSCFSFVEWARDITESKNTQVSLKDNEERLSYVLEATDEGVWDWNFETNAVYFSPRYFTMLGYDPYEFEGSYENWSSRLHEDDRENVEGTLKKILDDKEEHFSFEFRMRRKDGTYAWILSRGKVVEFEEGGNPKRVIGTHVDITQRRLDEEKLKEHALELKNINEELERFAYVTSHDLQEPIRTITNYLTLFKRRYSEGVPEHGLEFIDFAVNAALRMRDLIKDLLEYSRAGNKAASKAPVDMNQVYEHVISALGGLISERGVEIKKDALPEVLGVFGQIEQVLMNFFSNAVKFCKDKTPEIHLGYEEKEDEYVFFVSDNGIGIDEQYKDNIFEVFRRLHTRKEYDGTGIGLAICKKIINNHGGRVWVESTAGEGATFYFTLPK